MRSRTVVRALPVTLDAFTAVSAVAGGVALAAGLEGDRFPLELLRSTPFRSYVVPGVILAVIVGGSAGIAASTGLGNQRVFPATSMLGGIVLLGWIVGGILMLPLEMQSLMEVGYLAVGLLIAGVGLLLWALDHGLQAS